MEPLIFKEKIAFHRKWPDENLREAGFGQAKKGVPAPESPLKKMAVQGFEAPNPLMP
jgi:hypothetical protein